MKTFVELLNDAKLKRLSIILYDFNHECYSTLKKLVE